MSSINKDRVRAHFDRHAHEYDTYALVQVEMMKLLLANVAQIPTAPATILEVGCGTGRLTEQLLLRFPEACVTAIDLAPAMLEQTRVRVARELERVTLVCADAEAWVADCTEQYDLIVSNATLQWFADAPSAVLRMRERLTPVTGQLHVTTLGPGTFHEFHRACAVADAQLGLPQTRRGQQFASLDAWQGIFDAAEAHARVTEHASPRAFMDAVRRIGASRADDSAAPLTKAYLRALDAAYESYRLPNGNYPATYDVIVGNCVAGRSPSVF